MTITGAIVLYAVLWFMGMLIAIPLGLETHGDTESQDQITPAYSPHNPDLGRKAVWVSIISAVIWAALCGIILSGMISIEDIDFFDRM